MKKTILALVVAMAFIACSNSDSSTSSAAEEVAQATETSISYSVDSDASNMKWHGEKITGDEHNGTVRISKGTLSIENGALTAGNFEVDMTAIAQTDEMEKEWEAKLIGHLSGPDFFDVEKFPTAKFDISEVKSDSLIGNLTIKGITKSIAIPYSLQADASQATATAQFSINRADWDVRFGSGRFFSDLGDNLIKDEITFDVSLVTRV